MLQCLCGKSLKKTKNPSGKTPCVVLPPVTALLHIAYGDGVRSAIAFVQQVSAWGEGGEKGE